MTQAYSQASLAEHFDFHLKRARHSTPLASEILKYFGLEDVDLALKVLRLPDYELPNLHRGLRRFRDWRLDFVGGEISTYGSPLWAPTYRRVEVRPRKFVSYLVAGSQFYRLPGGGRRVALFEYEYAPDTVQLTLIGPRDEGPQLRRELAALVRFGKRRHYLRGQAVRGNATLLGRGPRVTWDDVALDAATRCALEENTLGILRRRDLFRRNGIPQKRGVLLYGPPGTGKTMIGKALADAHAGTFVWVTAADVTSSDALRQIFTLARKLRPSIVFLEDLDLFASERGGGSNLALGELLCQMDGLESNDGVIVVATTNDLAAIEPALAERPSRFDVVLEIGLPAASARHEILSRQLARQSASEEILDAAVRDTEGLTGAQLREVAFLAIQRAVLRGSLDERLLAQVDAEDLSAAAEQVSGRRKRAAIGFSAAPAAIAQAVS